MYYYSPLNVNIFGATNMANEILHAYIYDESEAAKSGNNITSLLYKDLEEQGFIKAWEESRRTPGNRLTLCFDNYAGQNKNLMVIRFDLWIVDVGMFEIVEIMFLIASHTKNICDRRFKDLKKALHKADIFSMVKLLKLMNQNDKVKAI